MDPGNILIKYLSLTLLFILPVLTSNVQIYDLPVDIQPGGEQKCQPLFSPVCNINSYLTVQPFNNTLGHTSLDLAIAEMHKFAYLITNKPCKSKIQLFLCALYAPVCVNSTILDRLLLPCRDDCEEAQAVCTFEYRNIPFQWPDEWDCGKFNYHKDDKLCVIDNGRERQPVSSAHPSTHFSIQSPPSSNDSIQTDLKQPYLQTQESTESLDKENMCAEDLFDCQLKDPLRNMNALCIDPSWVCDGKKDCVINGIDHGLGGGLDEVGCEKKCIDGQLFCDGKCISRSDICNGKVDCSLGTDEQDCYDYLTGLIQSILCIIALLSAVYLLVRFSRIDNQKPEDSVSEDHVENREYSSSERDLEEEYKIRPLEETISNNRIDQHFECDSPQRIYHEPHDIYSKLTTEVIRNEYERYNFGGNSGQSSVYAYNIYHRMDDSDDLPTGLPPDDSHEPPAAPPPTPAPQQFYSSGSITKMPHLYVNMTHNNDLLG